MKKNLITITLTLVVFLAVPTISVLAAEPGVISPLTPTTRDICCGPNSVMETIVNWLFTILLTVAALFIIIAAYYFVTASGNPETVSKARNFVLWALVGVAIAIASRGLVSLVGKITGA
jgi:hypothetical protein